MALTVRVIAAPLLRRFAALALAFALAGCGDTVNNSLFDRLAAGPAVPMPARTTEIVPTAQAMGGRWVLTMPGTGSCGVTFGPTAAGGSVHFIVGIANSAPSLVPDGQRAVTVLVLV